MSEPGPHIESASSEPNCTHRGLRSVIRRLRTRYFIWRRDRLLKRLIRDGEYDGRWYNDERLVRLQEKVSRSMGRDVSCFSLLESAESVRPIDRVWLAIETRTCLHPSLYSWQGNEIKVVSVTRNMESVFGAWSTMRELADMLADSHKFLDDMGLEMVAVQEITSRREPGYVIIREKKTDAD